MRPCLPFWQTEQRRRGASAFPSPLHAFQKGQRSGYSVHTRSLQLSSGISWLPPVPRAGWMRCRKLGAIVHKSASFGFQEEKSAPSALHSTWRVRLTTSIPAFNLGGVLSHLKHSQLVLGKPPGAGCKVELQSAETKLSSYPCLHWLQCAISHIR